MSKNVNGVAGDWSDRGMSLIHAKELYQLTCPS
jgi:hypothetical protein